MKWLSKFTADFFQNNNYSRIRRISATVMAGIVVFGTTYSLILPAITADADTAADVVGMYLEDTESVYAEENVYDTVTETDVSDAYDDYYAEVAGAAEDTDMQQAEEVSEIPPAEPAEDVPVQESAEPVSEEAPAVPDDPEMTDVVSADTEPVTEPAEEEHTETTEAPTAPETPEATEVSAEDTEAAAEETSAEAEDADEPESGEATEEMTEEAEAETTEESTEEAAEAVRELSFAGTDFEVRIVFDSDTDLPEDTQLVVTEYTQDSDRYNNETRYKIYHDRAFTWLMDQGKNALLTDRYFQLSFVSDGETYYPEQTAQIRWSIFTNQTVKYDEQEAVLAFLPQPDGSTTVTDTWMSDAGLDTDGWETVEFPADHVAETTYAVTLYADRRMEDGTYLVLADGNDGQSYALSSDGLAVLVPYAADSIPESFIEENQNLLWEKNGNRMTSLDGTSLLVSGANLSAAPIADSGMDLIIDQADAAGRTAIYTADSDTSGFGTQSLGRYTTYYLPVLSGDHSSFYTGCRYDQPEHNLVLIPADLPAPMDVLEETAEPTDDGDPEDEEEEEEEEDPYTKDGVTISRAGIRWLTKSQNLLTGWTADEPAGTDTLELVPGGATAYKIPNMQWQLDFWTDGEGFIDAGGIEIVLPAYIWKDRYDREPGLLTLAIPEEPSTSQDFAWKRVGDFIYITNTRSLPAAGKYMVQGTFRHTYPDPSTEYSFRTEYAYQMIDDTLSDPMYFTVQITTPNNGVLLTRTSNEIRAHIDTQVNISSATKRAVSSSHGTVYVNLDKYPLPARLTSILPEALPEGTSINDYYYVRWYIGGTASGNQAFDMAAYPQGQFLQSNGQPLEHLVVAREEGSSCVPYVNGVCDSLTLAQNSTNLSGTIGKYIWVAYPRSQFTGEGETYTIRNRAKVEVTGRDDGVKTSRTVEAYASFRTPIIWKIDKVWEYNEEKYPFSTLEEIQSRQPSSLRVWFEQNGYTVHTDYLQDGNEWHTEYEDNGQIGTPSAYEHSYRVTSSTHGANAISEPLASGNIGERVYLPNGSSYQRRWWYDHRTTSYDPDTHTWTFYNDYHEGTVWTAPSSWGKSASRYTPDWWAQDSMRDRDLNLLERDKETTDLTYSVRATQFLLDQTTENYDYAEQSYDYYTYPDEKRHTVRIELDDTSEYFQGRLLGKDDYYIRAVSLNTPSCSIWKPTGNQNTQYDVPEGEFIPVDPNPVTLYGLTDNGQWIELAVRASDGTITTSNGATASGSLITLPYDTIRQVRASLETDYASVTLGYTLHIRLKPSEAIKAQVASLFEKTDYAMGVHQNYASVKNYRDGKFYWSKQLTNRSPLHGRINRVAVTLVKKSKYTKLNLAEKYLRFHSTMALVQQSNMYNRADFLEAVENGYIPVSQSGTFYDLLPAGMRIDETTIKADYNAEIVSYDIIENYKGSGRQLVRFRVRLGDTTLGTQYPYDYKSEFPTFPGVSGNSGGYGRQHTISFDMVYSFEEVVNRGLDNLRNHSVYEADEEEFGNLQGWVAERDIPSGENHTATLNDKYGVRADARSLLTDLNPDHDNPVFVYAGWSIDTSEIDLWAETNLSKYVSITGTDVWRHGTRDGQVNVIEGGTYTYRMQVTSGSETITKDIILFDKMETYPPTEENGEQMPDGSIWRWNGKLESVDVSEIVAVGAAPVVYYTTQDVNLYQYKEEENPRTGGVILAKLQSGADGWTSVPPADMSQVKAIAIDCRKTPDGEDFELEEYESLFAYLNMRAPYYEEAPDAFATEGYDDPVNNAHAYNNCFMDCYQTNMEGLPGGSYAYINYDYTKVGIYSSNFDVRKVWDDVNDNDGKRPESVRVYLYADGEDTGREPLVLSEANDWTGRFEYVHKYDPQGRAYVYTVEEDPVEGYTTSWTLNGNVFTITNKHELEKTEFPFYKLWDKDPRVEGDWESVIPRNITVRLFADGVYTGKALTVRTDKSNEISGLFTSLQKYNNRQEIVYSIQENTITNFITTYLDDDGAGETGKTTDGDGINNVIKNLYYPFADVTIQKIGQQMTALAAETEFEFTLSLQEYDAERKLVVHDGRYEYMILDANVQEPSEWVPDGDIAHGEIFRLKAGQKIRIKDIPVGVYYNVTEAPSPGWYMSGSSNTGLRMVPTNGITTTFTNRYNSSGSISLSANKELAGRALANNQFSFRLKQNGTYLRSAYNLEDGTVTFGNINYTYKDDGKEFIYTIEEANNGRDGYTYDDTVYYVKVYPVDNGDGTMTVNAAYYKDVTPPLAEGETQDPDQEPVLEQINPEDVIFHNEYHAEGARVLTAGKRLDTVHERSDLRQDEHAFTFELWDLNAEEPELLQTQTNDRYTVTFDGLVFDETDVGKTFYYGVREIPGETPDPTVIYDESRYYYAITVFDRGNGTLYFTTYTNRADVGDDGTWNLGLETDEEGNFVPPTSSEAAPNFVNRLKDGSLKVTKDIQGEDGNPNQLFTFRVTLRGATTEDPTNPDLNLEYGPAPTDPETSTGSLSSTQYGIRFDPNEGSGSMSPRYATSNQNYTLPYNYFRRDGYVFSGWKLGGYINYNNRYNYRYYYGDRSVINSNTFRPNQWIDAAAQWIGRPQPVSTNYDSSVYQVITFYLMSGDTMTINHIPAGVRYTVEEKLESGWQLVSKTGEAGVIQPTQTSQAEFVNEFHSGETTVEILGTKVLDGTLENVQQFEFELYDITGVADADQLKPVEIKTPGADGVVRFSALTYKDSDLGDHYYIVKEKKGDRTDLTYDDHVEIIVVRVMSEGGSISAQIVGTRTVRESEVVNKPTVEIAGTLLLGDASADIQQRRFQLYNSSGEPVGNPVSPDADGTVSFGEITFTLEQTGTHYYWISETGEDEPSQVELIEVRVRNINNAVSAGIIDRRVINTDDLAEEMGNTEIDNQNFFGWLFPSDWGLKNPDTNTLRDFVSDSDRDIGQFDFTNLTHPGNISVQKDVDYPEGSDVDISRYDFTFAITLKDKAEEAPGEMPGDLVIRKKDAAGARDVMYDQNGIVPEYADLLRIDGNVITVRLKANETALLENLPAGWIFEIQETDLPAGWHLKGMRVNDVSGSTGTVVSDVTQEAVIENYYAASGSATLMGHKKLEGETLTKGRFEFGLYAANAQGEPGELLGTAKNDDRDRREEILSADDTAVPNPWFDYSPFRFDPIHYTQEDIGKTYTYYIKEIIPDPADDRVLYAENVEKATVLVEDAGNGYLKTTVTYYEGDQSVTAPEFINRLKPGELKIAKRIENATQAAQDTEFAFTITLTEANGTPLTGSYEYTVYRSSEETAEEGEEGEPMVVRTGTIAHEGSLSVKGGEWAVIRGLPDGARYCVTEGENPPGWEIVTPAAGAAEGTIQANQTAESTFINKYATNGVAEIFATKELWIHYHDDQGEEAEEQADLEGGEFEFILTKENGEVLDVNTNDAEGDVYFVLNYQQEDDGNTFIYYLREVVGSDPLMQYDKRNYKIVVTVNDNGEGTLVPEIRFIAEGASEEDGEGEEPSNDPPTFRNEQFEELGEFTLRKVDIEKGEDDTDIVLPGAEFQLYRKNKAGVYTRFDDSIQITDDNGQISFRDLPEGSYLLTEQKPAPGYIIIDKDIYFTLTLEKEQETDPESKTKLTITDPEGNKQETNHAIWVEENGDFVLRVTNRRGAALPMTGGNGVLAYQLGGLGLMMVSALLLAVLKRRRHMRK